MDICWSRDLDYDNEEPKVQFSVRKKEKSRMFQLLVFFNLRFILKSLLRGGAFLLPEYNRVTDHSLKIAQRTF